MPTLYSANPPPRDFNDLNVGHHESTFSSAGGGHSQAFPTSQQHGYSSPPVVQSMGSTNNSISFPMPPLSALGISNLVPPPTQSLTNYNTPASYNNGAIVGGLPQPPIQIPQSQQQSYLQPQSISNPYMQQQQNGNY